MVSTPDPTYITAAEVRAQTKNTELKTLTPADVNYLIQTSEDQIDAFVGQQRHHIYDTNVTRVFPREQDYQRTNLVEYPATPEIPYQVSKACLRQVEWLFTQWWPNRDTDEMPIEHDVSQVSVGGDGSTSEVFARGGMDLAAASLCPAARSLLARFRSRSAGISLSNPRGRNPYALSSREGQSPGYSA